MQGFIRFLNLTDGHRRQSLRLKTAEVIHPGTRRCGPIHVTTYTLQADGFRRCCFLLFAFNEVLFFKIVLEHPILRALSYSSAADSNFSRLAIPDFQTGRARGMVPNARGHQITHTVPLVGRHIRVDVQDTTMPSTRALSHDRHINTPFVSTAAADCS